MGNPVITEVFNNYIDTITNNIKDALLLSTDEVVVRDSEREKENKPVLATEIIDLCDKRES
ncbi:hypothetical protein DPMN_118319 [Dreissena polymorpha]|uniref:Uncharacterized protein n=1 Tax=Dreissena polymorpha TaxID=45954 RepID=A0A9D4GG73_DREPO|nr:hypothetical protein DPMN_118319 [Dreissena polymorpha]